MKCEKCSLRIPESIGECTYCNDGIPEKKDSIPIEMDGILG